MGWGCLDLQPLEEPTERAEASAQVAAGAAGRGRGPNTVLIVVLTSVITAVVMVLAAPYLAYPALAGMLRSEITRVERQVERLAGTAPDDGERPVRDGTGTAPDPLEVPRAGGGPLPPVTAVTQAAEKAGPAVVGVIARPGEDDAYGPGVSGGSGVIVDRQGHIVTNHHVVEGARSLTVILSDGRRLPASLVGADRLNDIAVLKVNAERLPVAELGDSDRLRIGDLAVAIGNPVDLVFQRTVTTGIISGLNRSLYMADPRSPLEVIQTDAAISPGNSGGPLVNALGQVIGINTAKISLPGVEGMGFAIPINRVKTVVSLLLATGKVTWPWLGVELIDREQADEAGIELERGVYIDRVVSGGPADRAGIRRGDVVIRVGGQTVNSYFALRRALESHRVGESVQVVVVRAGREMALRVTLDARPEEE